MAAIARRSEDGPSFAASGEPFPWFAVRVKPNFERQVSRILRFKGYVDFLPTYKRRSQWSDRVKEIEWPLFPGYVFCRFDASHRLPILMSLGVFEVVSFDGQCVPADETEISALQILLTSGVPLEPWPFLKVGNKVRFRYGSLAGTEGILTAVKNTYRVVVSISLLHRSVAAEVPPEWLEPAR